MANFMLFIATFRPPDFTADMYDTIPEDDLDFEDIEWQKWLQGLINSGTHILLQPSPSAGVTSRKICGSVRPAFQRPMFKGKNIPVQSARLECKYRTRFETKMRNLIPHF